MNLYNLFPRHITKWFFPDSLNKNFWFKNSIHPWGKGFFFQWCCYLQNLSLNNLAFKIELLVNVHRIIKFYWIKFIGFISDGMEKERINFVDLIWSMSRQSLRPIKLNVILNKKKIRFLSENSNDNSSTNIRKEFERNSKGIRCFFYFCYSNFSFYFFLYTRICFAIFKLIVSSKYFSFFF